MTNIILHIGPHKTGSTYIQKNFFEAREALLEKDIYYPTEFSRLYGHHLLPAYLNEGKYSLVESIFKEVLKNAKYIILSSENLSTISRESVYFLCQLLSKHNTTIVYYYRCPSIRLFSLWKESIKHGGVHTYFEYVYEHYTRPYSSKEFFNTDVLESFSNTLDKKSVIILNYDIAHEQESLISSFSEAVGLDLGIKDSSEDVNKSSVIEYSEILRMLNVFAKHDGLLQRHNVRDQMRIFRENEDHGKVTKLIEYIRGSRYIEIDLGHLFADNLYGKQVRINWEIDDKRTINQRKIINVPSQDWILAPEARALIDYFYSNIKTKL